MSEICKQWLANKNINPRTGRKITPTGKVYKELEIECKSLANNSTSLKKLCDEFKKNPNVNPETKRTIQKGKGVYNKYMKICKDMGQKISTTLKKTTPKKSNQATSVVKLKIKNKTIVQDCDVYIGRQCFMGGWKLQKSKWANPYKITPECSREQVLINYEKYIKSKPELFSSLSELKGKKLGCWCHPNSCHGDVLVKLIETNKI